MPRDHEHYLRLAIAEALRGKAAGEFPFGALVVDPAGEVVVAGHDTAVADGDRSSHAETMLVKRACKLRGPDLIDHTVYTTTEPCPMCFTTCWLAKVGTIVWGATMAQVAAKTRGMLHELTYPAPPLNAYAGDRIRLYGGVLADECLAMFDDLSGVRAT